MSNTNNAHATIDTEPATASAFATIVRILAPAAYWADFDASERPSRSDKVAARRVIVHAWADMDAGRACVIGRFTVTMSDGSNLPARLWIEGQLSIREGGRAYGVGVK